MLLTVNAAYRMLSAIGDVGCRYWCWFPLISARALTESFLQERELLAAEDIGTDQQPQSAPAETAEEAAPAEEAAASVNAQQLQRQV